MMAFAIGRHHIPAHQRQLFLRHRKEFGEAKLHAEHGECAPQHAGLHIQGHRKTAHFVFGQIHFLIIDKNRHFAEIHGIDGFAEIFRIAVFPPTDAGFIGKPHASDISAQMAVGRIALFKAAARAHIAVAQAGEALLQALVGFIQRG